MRFVTTFFAAVAGLALGAPLKPQCKNTAALSTHGERTYRTADIISAFSTIATVKPPIAPKPEMPTFTIEKRDDLWPWEKPQHYLGEYPDGRPKCRIFSATK